MQRLWLGRSELLVQLGSTRVGAGCIRRFVEFTGLPGRGRVLEVLPSEASPLFHELDGFGQVESCVVADGATPPFDYEDQSFDLVCSLQVIPNDVELAEWVRVLRCGGTLAFLSAGPSLDPVAISSLPALSTLDDETREVLTLSLETLRAGYHTDLQVADRLLRAGLGAVRTMEYCGGSMLMVKARRPA